MSMSFGGRSTGAFPQGGHTGRNPWLEMEVRRRNLLAQRATQMWSFQQVTVNPITVIQLQEDPFRAAPTQQTLLRDIAFYRARTLALCKEEGDVSNRAFFRSPLDLARLEFGESADTLGEELYQRLAERGYPEGQYLYAESLLEKDPASAIEWHLKAALQEFVPSQYRLGVIAMTDRGTVKANKTMALHYLVLSSSGGYRWAFYALGFFYETGTYGAVNLPLALEWYKAGSIK